MGTHLVAEDLSDKVSVGTFAAAGDKSAAAYFYGGFNITIAGDFAGLIVLQRSFDAAATWHDCARDSAGTLLSWTGAFSGQWAETERGVMYRLDCRQLTSGMPTYRISQ